VVRGTDPRGRPLFWVGFAGAGQDAGPGTDFHAIEAGRVSVTPLKVDLTKHEDIGRIERAGWGRRSLTDRSDPNGIGMTSARTRDRLVQRLKDHGIADHRVLERIRSVPRHLFVDEALASRAYEDTALPIGLGQTISQPWVVARMTEAVVAEPTPEKSSRSARDAATRRPCSPASCRRSTASSGWRRCCAARARCCARWIYLQRAAAPRRWLAGLEQACAVRRHHGDRGAGAGAADAAGPA
jgi:hypothetical protein